MRLADQLKAAVGSWNDDGLAGSITSLASALARAECFELSNEIRAACFQVSKSKPSSILLALALTRLPYETTWIEWQAFDDPDRDPETEDRPAPSRMGCLLEASGPALLCAGRMTWAWSHRHITGDEIMVCPYSYRFDWREEADLIQQISSIINAALPDEEKKSRLRAAGFDTDLVAMRRLLKWAWASSGTDDAAAAMRKTRKWARVSSDQKEQAAYIRLENKGIVQPSDHCRALWHRGPELFPDFAERRLSWLEDLVGEPPFIEAFFALLNSKHAVATTRDDLSRLNKARARRGNAPLREFLVTRLNLSRGHANRGAAHGMSRAEAEWHMVRGHFKVRKTGIYWWSPFPRGGVYVAPRTHYAVVR